MKSKISIFLVLLLSFAASSFKEKNGIDDCFISFKTTGNLTASQTDKLPETSEKVRSIKTENGEVEITRIDGYRVLYNNSKQVPFVNLKVELSDLDAYENDKKRLVENLNYLNNHSIGMETKELIRLKFNGYEIIGLSRASIEQGSTLGTFVMFPGNGVTVYFYFNNLKPEFRNFESVEDYKKQRDAFFSDYTEYVHSCLG
jgi:hypothetical protein